MLFLGNGKKFLEIFLEISRNDDVSEASMILNRDPDRVAILRSYSPDISVERALRTIPHTRRK